MTAAFILPRVASLWSRVQKSDGCWNWTGGRCTDGYGGFYYSGNKKMGPHRAAWIATHGDIAPGLQICHRCDNRLCCNPDHMFLGTVADNIHDMCAKGRQVRGERAPHSRLRESQVLELRELYAAGGINRAALGRRFGVTTKTVSWIVKRKTWAWLGRAS